MFSPNEILNDLPISRLPRRVLSYTQIGSTMDAAREHLHSAGEDTLPMLVIAGEQTAGRGRQKRPWYAPPESALLFSLALRPSWMRPADASVLVWMTGVALCEGIQEQVGIEPRMKWPNDVLLQSKKIAGILLETSSGQDSLHYAVLGCGINVSASPPPETVRYPATHLTAVLNHEIDRLALLRAVLVRLDYWYSNLQDDMGSTRVTLFKTWHDKLETLGKHIQIQTASGMLEGVAEDVELSGALRLRDTGGGMHLISSGDIFGPPIHQS